MKKPKVAEVRDALYGKIMDQYQKAGQAYEVADTAIWAMMIMDSCSAVIDALSWVLGEGDISGQLTGECCDPFNPYVHEDKETEDDMRKGYQAYKRDLIEFIAKEGDLKC